MNNTTKKPNMKKTTRLIIAVITTAFITSMSAGAKDIESPAKDFGAKGKKTPPKRLLDKFDKDGDGTLNESERDALRQTMSQHREANRAKMLQRFDSDKNGQLSPEEKKAAMPIIIEERKKIKAAVLQQFDQNDDGKLSDSERDGIRAWVKENHPDAITMRPRRACLEKGTRAQNRGPKKKNLND